MRKQIALTFRYTMLRDSAELRRLYPSSDRGDRVYYHRQNTKIKNLTQQHTDPRFKKTRRLFFKHYSPYFKWKNALNLQYTNLIDSALLRRLYLSSDRGGRVYREITNKHWVVELRSSSLTPFLEFFTHLLTTKLMNVHLSHINCLPLHSPFLTSIAHRHHPHTLNLSVSF